MNINRESDPPFVYKYSPLKNITRYACEAPCLCRFGDERTRFDLEMITTFNPNKNVVKESYYDGERTQYDEMMNKKYRPN